MSIAAMLGDHEDRPSQNTISILATDEAFDSLIHISLPTNPRLWHWLWHSYLWSQPLYMLMDTKIRSSHEICKFAYKKVLEMGPGNSSFQIYFPISPNNIIS
jgi:hypothetical protein